MICIDHFSQALQTEFGDFSEDIHGEGDYFLLEHYLPAAAARQLGGGEAAARQNLVRLHRAHLGQSQSKTEIRYCKEVQRNDNYGFHNFAVTEGKKHAAAAAGNGNRRRHLGIHLQVRLAMLTRTQMIRLLGWFRRKFLALT